MSTSAEDAGFLEAICTAPDDAMPRLAYADWLDERGGPGDADRAWFIRTQCRPGYAPDWAEGAPRAAVGTGTLATPEMTAHKLVGPAGYRLLGWDADGWVCYAPAEPDPQASQVDIRFARGLVSEVRCPARHWLERAEALFWHPAQKVYCTACVPDDEVRPRRPSARERRRQNGTTERHGEPDPVSSGLAKGPRSRCPACSGTGRAPRPFVPTAQPLSRVTLTTTPLGHRTNYRGRVEFYFMTDGATHCVISDAEVRAQRKRKRTGPAATGPGDSAGHAPTAVLAMLEAAWPVAFALPPEPFAGPPAGVKREPKLGSGAVSDTTTLWAACLDQPTGDPADASPDQRGVNPVGVRDAGAFEAGTVPPDTAIDTFPPVVTISRPSVSRVVAGRRAVVFLVSYSDPNLVRATLAAKDVVLKRTGTANGRVRVELVNETTFRVVVFRITGHGTLGIGIKAGTAADGFGQLAPEAGPSARFAVVPPFWGLHLTPLRR